MGIFAGAPDYPYPPFPERTPVDLRLKDGTDAVDAGLIIPNVNDFYSGAAPDLGAHEVGQALPTYGPRSVDGETPRVSSAASGGGGCFLGGFW